MNQFIYLFRKFFIPVIFALLPGVMTAQSVVTLYENCNYSGKQNNLEPGTYSLYQMKVDNDKLSCLQIPSGMKVTLYENDNFKGRSKTFYNNIPCLDNEWNDMASSLVVENTAYQPTYNQQDYVIFYNNCNFTGFSRTLKPGTYSSSELGNMKNNISSFSVYGNLRVKVYTGSDNASGYFKTFDASESCLGDNYNDKISSLAIEYKPAGGNTGGYGGNNNYRTAALYTDCNYEGNSIRLLPGYYQGEKLGLFRYDISSAEIPAGLRVKVYTNETLSGSYTLITENTNCLGYNLNNRIGSFIVEETGFSGNNNNNLPMTGNVVIFTDANYRGQSVTILPGTYGKMAETGFPDNALSSITVPAGFRVVIYEFENFAGKSLTITESKSGFLLSSWNDKTSSIAVYRDR